LTTLYRMFRADGSLLYVGISDQVLARWSSHSRERPWWSEVQRFEVEQFDSRDDALRAEAQAIVDERPLHNIRVDTVPVVRVGTNEIGPFVGIAEIAKALGVSRGLVAQWYKRGKLPEPTARLAMGPVWTAEAIDPWIASR